MKKSEKGMQGKEVLHLKNRIRWILFFRLSIIAILLAMVIVLYFFSDFEIELNGGFWKIITSNNIWKFVAFILVILGFGSLFGFLSKRVQSLRDELDKFIKKPEKVRKKNW